MSERRLKVLALVDAPTAGTGAERLAARVAARIDRSLFEPYLCASRRSSSPTLTDALTSLGVRTLELERSSRWDVASWLPLARLLREERVDIVHAHKFASNVWGTLIGRAARVPVIVAHEHSWQEDDPRYRIATDRWVIGNGADAMVAVSPEDRRRMLEIERIRPSRARYIPTGIPAPRLSGHNVRAEQGIPADAFVLGAVAVLRPIKALDLLVSAAAMLRPRHANLRLLIAGSGPDEARLRALAESLGVADIVTFLGSRADVADVVHAFDVAVCCSDAEGLPASVLEYMACGAPVIATRVGAIPHVIRHGETGLLVDPQDPEALAAAASRLLEDEVLRTAIAANARELQRSEFSIETMVRRLERLYVELFGKTRRAVAEGWRPPPGEHTQADEALLSKWAL
jgi:glycosyltransferase involved in cell wall biosynthesis